MLQITITEINIDEDNRNQRVIELLNMADEIIDAMLLNDFEAQSQYEEQLTEISTLLFIAQCRLAEHDDMTNMN